MTLSPLVLLVEDHELLAQTLSVALRAEGFHVHTANVQDLPAVVTLAQQLLPRVILLDLDLGREDEGGEALIPALVATGSHVIVVSGISDPIRLGTCLELGAAGVLSKTRPFEDILAAVAAAAADRPVMSEAGRLRLEARLREARQRLRQREAPFARLTPRERDVLAQLIRGRPADAIAEDFVVSETTVRTQIRGVLTKLGVKSQLAAVAEAHRLGWRHDG